MNNRAAFARTDDVLFVDARPPYHSGRLRPASTRVLKGEYLGDGKFRVRVEWRAIEPLEEGLKSFVHVVHKKSDHGERIVPHGDIDFDGAAMAKAGTYEATIDVTIPPDSFGGEYTLRYGLYNPGKGGYRVTPAGNIGHGGRARGGKLKVDIADGKITGGEYMPEGEWDHLTGLNTKLAMVDFGPVATNGAFRLLHPIEGEWLLLPLPGSIGFEARFDLAKLGRTASRATVSRIDPLVQTAAEPVAELKNGVLGLKADGGSFAYRIVLE